MSVMIAGVSSGSGKTTLTIGLMRALTNRGVSVAAFKSGPDYIDPMFHRLATKGSAYNLPTWMVEKDALKRIFSMGCTGKDIGIVEGVMGYYDGHDIRGIEGSSAKLAEVLDLNVIIVMDGSSMALTAAAIVNGLKTFYEPTQIKGVIFNRVKSSKHYALLKEAVEHHTDIRCYGYIEPDDALSFESRHLGLVQVSEENKSEEKIEHIARHIEKTVDIEGILKLHHYKGLYAVDEEINTRYDNEVHSMKTWLKEQGGLKLGIARDHAFSFYYEENLKLLEEIGVECVPFSPLSDHKLPDAIEGLYLGGGYPEIFADKLQSNTDMRNQILSAAQNGLPMYAECGGLMYLMRQIEQLDGSSHEMVGVFDGTAVMTRRLQRFGHVEATLYNGIKYRGHEFHHSIIKNCSEPTQIEVQKNADQWKCGYYQNNVLATYVHNHFYSNLEFVRFLLAFYLKT